MVVKKEIVRESMNPYEKPPRQSFSKFIYNPSTGAFMGRTIQSWGKIGLFYLIFFGVLAALFAICLWAFFMTIDPTRPKWQLDYSLIGTNPGLGFRPMPPSENVESTLIWFKASDPNNRQYWVDSLKEFLAEYKRPGTNTGENRVQCGYDKLPKRGEVCHFDLRQWDPCNEEDNFQYHKSSPCIFLKLNKIFGWIPDYYNTTKGLPDQMPITLKNHIAQLESDAKHELNTIWVSCDGENPADQEHIGPIQYIPRRGFPGYFYPYENSKGYRSPLVAVYFERPKTGILINIECKAWARNIIHNRHEKLGSVHFELLID